MRVIYRVNSWSVYVRCWGICPWSGRLRGPLTAHIISYLTPHQYTDNSVGHISAVSVNGQSYNGNIFYANGIQLA